MVAVKNIKAYQFKNIGFKTKKEALKFITEHGIKSNKKESENIYIDRVLMKKEEINNQKIVNIVDKINNNISKGQDITINENLPSDIVKEIIKKINVGSRKLMYNITYDNNEIRTYFGDRSNFYQQDVEKPYGSDQQEKITNRNVVSINIKEILKTGNHKSLGAFFKYYNKSIIDLKKYAIYKNKDEANYKDNCLIYSLVQSGSFTTVEINNIRLHCKRRETSLKTLNIISDMYNITFNIYRYRNDSEKIEKKSIIKENGKIIDLALFDNHWFLYEDVNITRYFITNYENIKQVVDTKLIDYQNVNKLCKRTNNYIIRNDRKDTLNSLALINLMYKHNMFEKIKLEEAYEIPYYDYFKDEEIILTDENICGYRPKVSSVYIPCLEKNKDDINYEYIVYADFETTTMKKDKINSDKHKAFMISYIITDLYDNIISKNTFYGDDIVDMFLGHIMDKSIIYFHNLKYDKNFIFDYITILKYTEKEGMLYEIDALYKKKNIRFRDSYKLISKPLSDFSSMFDLEVKKEVFPYNFYNENNIENILNGVMMSICLAKKHIPEEKHILFDECIKNVDHTKTKFNALQYAIYYCEQDVRVLYEGVKTFRKLVLEALKIDVFDKLTISSVAEQYLINEGCYNNVYEISGVAQTFINKSVYGGRVMIAKNEPIEVNINLQDFDGVSLYPSAMSIIDGFPIEEPSLIDEFFDVDDKNLYYIEIELLDEYYKRGVGNKINIEKIDNIYQQTDRYEFDYDFPLFADKDKDGVIQYTNFPKNRLHVVNNYIMKDLIKFYNLEKNVHYKIKQGLTFNKGFNPKIKEVIKFLFNERIKQKKVGNKLQEIYKLIMNSSYGKTLTKYNDTSIIIFNTKDIEKINNYYYKNYNNIKEVFYTKRHTIVKIYKEFSNHWNCVHIGSAILARSKNIMNNVFYECHIKGLTPFYQDTDSIHIPEVQVSWLPNNLIGKDMCQFHCDFDDKPFKNSIDKSIQYEGEAVYSSNAIFIAKKCYIDILHHRQSNEINYHIRFKGNSEEIITKTGKDRNQNPYELYRSLLNREKIEFNDKHSSKPKFKQISICDISNREDNIKTFCI